VSHCGGECGGVVPGRDRAKGSAVVTGICGPATRLARPSSVDPAAVQRSGSYTVAVSKDKGGTEIVARGSGMTVAAGTRLLLGVTLDLRRAQVGSYFLARVRESDNGTYYYPLKVQNH
jgi:hypothetical protein